MKSLYLLLLVFSFCSPAPIAFRELSNEARLQPHTEHSTEYTPLSKCRISGVYSQLCLKSHKHSKEETNAQYRHYFNCFSKSVCVYRQGHCQWLKTKQFKECLKRAKRLSVHSEIRTVSNLIAHPTSFTTNPVVTLSDPLNDDKSVGRVHGTTNRVVPRELLFRLH